MRRDLSSARVSRSAGVDVMAGIPENLRDLLVKPHPDVGVNGGVHQRGSKQIDELPLLGAEAV